MVWRAGFTNSTKTRGESGKRTAGSHMCGRWATARSATTRRTCQPSPSPFKARKRKMEEIDPVEVPPMNSAIAFAVAAVAAVAPPSLPRTIDELQALFRLCMRKAAQQGYTPPAFDD